MKIKYLFACVSLFCLLGMAGFAAENEGGETVQITADEMGTVLEDGFTTFSGHVQAVYADMVLKADKAEINTNTGDFRAAGNVQVVRSGTNTSCAATVVQGNFQKKQVSFGPFRMQSGVWYGAGNGGMGENDQDIEIENGWISTCELPNPHYRLSARKFRISEDHTFSAKHLVLRVGPVPIFYLPYLSGNTDDNGTIILKLGYSGKLGAYLRLGRIWKPSFLAGGDGSISGYVDLMSKRGVGAGSDLNYQTTTRKVEAKVYGVLDSDAPETKFQRDSLRHKYNRRFKKQDERGRVAAYWREDLTDSLTLRVNVDLLSDIDMLEDWFRREYRGRRQPKTYLNLAWSGAWFDAGMEFRPRINDFYSVSQKLPEFYFDVPRIALADGLPLEYEGHTRGGYYSMKWRNFDLKRRELWNQTFGLAPAQSEELDDYSAWRVHTQHFLYLPVDLGDFGLLTPRAGMAVTYYSRSSKTRIGEGDLEAMIHADDPDSIYNAMPVRNYDSDGGSHIRTAFEFGMEWHQSYYGRWLDWTPDWIHAAGLRHVMEPYVNYTYIHEPSVNRDVLYYFDELDRLEKEHFIRFGLDQRLLSHRDGSQFTLVELNSYFDLFLERDDLHRRYGGQIGNRLRLNPRKGLSLYGTLVYDTNASRTPLAETGIQFGASEQLNFTAGYKYTHEDLLMQRSAYSLGSSLLDFSGENGYYKRTGASESVFGRLHLPLNELTSVDFRVEYDMDEHRMNEVSAAISRVFHCWKMDLILGWDNEEFEAGLLMSIVAFPHARISLNL